ncbi:MAG: 50S ribosomal protein L25 [Phycisphaerae bacterium]
MDKTFKLKAQIRDKKGTKASQDIRDSGRIPAVVYGHKEDAVSVSLDRHDFTEGVHHGRRLIDLAVGKKNETVIIRDVQYDYLGKEIIHADLMRVSASERIEVNVQVALKGTAKGQKEGGIVELHAASVEVECPVTQIPESIIIKIDDLDLEGKIFARDVQLPQGLKMVSDPETLVVSCHTVEEAKTTEEIEAEAPAGPEVIGEVKEDAEQAEEQQKE